MAELQGMAGQPILDSDATDGIRWTFTAWPGSRLESARCVVPFACLYTPLKKIEGMPVVPYDPILCKVCRAVLSPYCKVDYKAHMWVCPFCVTRNVFPHHYHEISEDNLPAELIPSFTTVEYNLPRPKISPPAFLFLVDTSCKEPELVSLKASLLLAIELLPRDAFVGLVTFGTIVQVHEIGYQECSKAYVFRGDKETTLQQVQEALGLGQRRGGPGDQQSMRFLQPIKDCQFDLGNIIEGLEHDPWPVQPDKRPLRATGVALSVAASLMKLAFPNHPSRILAFLNGPCTEGPGQVVGLEKKVVMRAHSDIQKGQASYWDKATKFYKQLADTLVADNISCDICAAALGQCGIAEMREIPERTGGSLVLTDTCVPLSKFVFSSCSIHVRRYSDPPAATTTRFSRTHSRNFSCAMIRISLIWGSTWSLTFKRLVRSRSAALWAAAPVAIRNLPS
jgi:protein transport protein SEC23